MAEAHIDKIYIAATRALLIEDGDPPLEFPGMLIYERAQPSKPGSPDAWIKKGASLLEGIVRIFGKKSDCCPFTIP
jgi:hypothetical protein